MSDLVIRIASPQDAPALLEIYGPYVENTAISFEYTTPTLEDFIGRMEKVLEKYPYLVAEEDGLIVGYAYASQFHARKAYDWCIETSIYIRQGWSGKGYGKQLYEELERILKMQHVINVNAAIAYKEEEDEYLTHRSREFHEHMGYTLAGEFNKCGYKFGRWYNMVWMEKMLGEHLDNPPKVIPITEILTMEE